MAAGSDALENVNLLVVAGGHTSQPWPGLALGFASLKFALVIPAALYPLLGWLGTVGRWRWPRREGPESSRAGKAGSTG